VEKLLIFIGMAGATFLTRYTLIAALGQQEPPSRLRRWLRYVPPAILAAIVVPAALTPQGHLELGPHVWAMVVGAAFAGRTRSALWTILGGMAAFHLLRLLGVQ